MRNAGLIVVMLMLFASSSAYGAALGQAQRASMFGYSIGAALVSVDDPVGDTDTVWVLQPVTLIYTARLWSSVRYWSELYYYQATLEAGLNKVGQDVRRYGTRLSLQKSLRVSPKWLAWFGVGVDISQAKYTSRHSIDSDGFLLETFSDREEIAAAGVINILGEWSLNRDWFIGVKLEQSFPDKGHVKESLATVTLLYRY